MKAALALATLVGLVAAQDFSSVPPCALGCLYKAIPETGCSMTDVDCLCRKEKQAQLQAAAGDCLNSQCSASDLTKAENLSKEICKQLTSSAPATVTVTAGGSSSSGSTSTTSSSVSAVTTALTNSTSSTWSNSTTATSATKTTSLETTATVTTTTTPSATRSPNAAAGTAAGALVAVVALAFAL